MECEMKLENLGQQRIFKSCCIRMQLSSVLGLPIGGNICSSLLCCTNYVNKGMWIQHISVVVQAFGFSFVLPNDFPLSKFAVFQRTSSSFSDAALRDEGEGHIIGFLPSALFILGSSFVGQASSSITMNIMKQMGNVKSTDASNLEPALHVAGYMWCWSREGFSQFQLTTYLCTWLLFPLIWCTIFIVKFVTAESAH